jgi:O-acetyl-ADP-ribose deacetylase (regulator of RNase III)
MLSSSYPIWDDEEEGRREHVIIESSGNLLRDDAQALVNTVNTVGIMGKGLALQFKRAYPEVFTIYADACAKGRVLPGQVFPVALGDGRWVLNFPTKRHWREKSRIEDIRDGLDDLVRLIADLELSSVAIPPLGCGNGGLPWPQVRSLIIEKLGHLPVEIRLYGLGTPDPADMPTRTKAPGASPERNRFLAALARYIASAWEAGVTESPRASVLEAQKVAYLLQAAGLDLRLTFVKHRYGPFSADLNRALATMEGHCLIGYGDGTGGARADLRLMPGVAEQAEESVREDKEFERAWAQVQQAVLGYEYPEGLELLSSVHLLARTTSHTREPDHLAEALAEWSPRKRHLFTSADARSAWQRLDQAELIASTG